jgi:hypothetical protein
MQKIQIKTSPNLSKPVIKLAFTILPPNKRKAGKLAPWGLS